MSSESPKLVGPEARRISRRRFVRLMGSMAAALAGTATAMEIYTQAMHENKVKVAGEFETDLAVWRPLYETHPDHVNAISPEKIGDVDVVSFEGAAFYTDLSVEEGNQAKSDLTADPSSVFTTQMLGADSFLDREKVIPRIPSQTLQHLQQNNIAIAVGDIETKLPSGGDIVAYSPDLIQFIRESYGLFLYYYGTILIGERATQLLTAESDKKPSMLPLSRRILVRGISLAFLGSVYQNWFAPNAHNWLQKKVMTTTATDDPNKRLWARLKSLENYLVPERLNDLFRELIQANKLMALAAALHRGSPASAKPRIAFNWHQGHRGIEDMLQLGPDIVRNMLLLYPDEIFKQIIAANQNDPRCLYAIRMIKPPKSLKLFDEVQADGSIRRSGSSYDQHVQPEELMIEDQQLKQALIERGLISPS